MARIIWNQYCWTLLRTDKAVDLTRRGPLPGRRFVEGLADGGGIHLPLWRFPVPYRI